MKIVENYVAAWNEQDAGARRELLTEVFTPNATFTDPLAAVSGVDDISAVIGAAQGQFPGLVVSLGGAVDQHHDLARFSWHLGAPDATEPLVIGFDVAQLHPDGKIASLYGFLDKVPQS
jgi:hypothetical protein